MWELTLALEKRVQLPPVDLPGFAGGEVHAGAELPRIPVEAACALRMYWQLSAGRIPPTVCRNAGQNRSAAIMSEPSTRGDWTNGGSYPSR